VIGVLVSGEGTNLQALIDEGLPIACVASNKPGAPALERAERAGIATEAFPAEGYGDRDGRDAAMAAWLEEHGARLVVCAGYMHLLRPCFLERFPGRVVNTHSAPLPDFPGARPIEDVLEAGVPETAATVHFVDEGVDSGPIILQEAIELPYPRDIAEIEDRLHEVEHRLLPRAIRLIAAGAVKGDADNPRVVRIENGQPG
jgi:phosphoribosylglycinamide formyltransferase 1